MTNPEVRKQLNKFPTSPGIYLFKSPKNKPLYIGKALNLKNRVRSYLKTNGPSANWRIQQMILEAKKIDFIKTDSDIEALILESQYIKKYRPDFNIMLRDDKQYSFVGFTQEEYSKIFITHQPTQFRNSNLETRNKSQILNSKFKTVSDFEFSASDFQYIGPFTDGLAIKTTLRLLRKIFPYCTCKQLHNNYCLNYHIGKCLGDCCLKFKIQNTKGKITVQNSKLKEYQKNINAIKKILYGKKSSLIKNLEKEMKTLSSQQEYEKALELQHKIEKLRKIFLNAQVINRNREVMIRHNSSRVLKSLQKILDLTSPPRQIEAYDVANIQGKYAVGVMVVFTDGLPDKNEYRLFKIRNSNLEIRNKSQILNSKFKTVSDFGFRASDFHPGGDTGMLKEILIRRFSHHEWAMPDLVLVDGGRAQFNTAKGIIKNIPIIALTKDEKHIGHKIIMNNRPSFAKASAGKEEILLSKLPINVKNLLLQINAEAHRFAISYYRNLHRKSLH